MDIQDEEREEDEAQQGADEDAARSQHDERRPVGRPATDQIAEVKHKDEDDAKPACAVGIILGVQIQLKQSSESNVDACHWLRFSKGFSTTLTRELVELISDVMPGNKASVTQNTAKTEKDIRRTVRHIARSSTTSSWLIIIMS